MNTFLASVRSDIEQVSDILKLPRATGMLLIEPKKIIEVTFLVRLDSGETEVFKGWCVQHNDTLGPYKGGIRFSPLVERDEVVALATTMGIKNAMYGLPYGGVFIDPLRYSTRELEMVARRYVDALFKMLGPDVDVPSRCEHQPRDNGLDDGRVLTARGAYGIQQLYREASHTWRYLAP